MTIHEHPESDDAIVFRWDEAACRIDSRFYEAFDIDKRWNIIRAILAATAGEKDVV
jgi:hypothetical protein